MTINCNLTESDYRAMRRYVIFRYRKLHWFFAVVLISLLAFVWFSNKPEATTGEKIAGLVGVAVVWVILMLIFSVAWKVIARFTGARFRGSIGPHVFEVSDDVLIESNSEGRIETRVAGIRHIAETSAHFFILTTTGRAHVVPKRDVQSFEPLRSLLSRVTK